MTRRLLRGMLLTAVVVTALPAAVQAPLTVNLPLMMGRPPGPCSPGGVCDRIYQQCKRQGGSESSCAAQRLSCWEYWRCA